MTCLAFDLDGTLVQTETLKAQSYAWAARQLRPDLDGAAVEAAYGDLVGHSREEIARTLLDRFGLAPEARARDARAEPWRVYVGLRLERYRAMLADGDLVRRNTWPLAAAVLEQARTLADRVALVTTSERWAVEAVLDALAWHGRFDTVVTADDVARVKPDPAGYRLALERLGAAPEHTLTVEDSPSGARAALAAGLGVLVVPTPYTRERVAAMVASGELARGAVVAPEALMAAVRQRLR